MFKFTNLKQLTANTLVGVLIAGSFVTPTSENKALAQSCGNNGHGNNMAAIVPDDPILGGNVITITGFDDSNPSDQKRNKLKTALKQGKTFKNNMTIEYSHGPFNLSDQQAEYVIYNVPDIEGNCDEDGDGISNIVEGAIDEDGDGIFNYADLDSDGDGNPDGQEPVTYSGPEPNVTGDLTADNHYGLLTGNSDGSELNLIGRNEYGPQGAPGTYNWSQKESWDFYLDENDYIYVVVWDDGNVDESWIGQFTSHDTETTLLSVEGAWEYIIANGANPGDYGEVPTNSELQDEISSADWQQVNRRGPNGMGPWGNIAGISNEADFLNTTTPSNGKYTIFRTQFPVLPALADNDADGVPNYQDTDDDVPPNIYGHLTADNHYGLFSGNENGSDLNFIGRNEYGSQGDPGTYNWSRGETWDFYLDEEDYIYVVVWDDAAVDESWIGEFFHEESGETLLSLAEDWEYIIASGTNPGDNGEVPSNAELADEISNANWQSAIRRGPNGMSPWGTIPGITGDADFLNTTTPSNGNYTIFRTKFAVIPELTEPENVDSDGNGILDILEVGSDPENPADNDSDGMPDFEDDDDNNNGTPDDEEGIFDINDDNVNLNDDNIIAYDLNEDGTPDIYALDTDGDSIPDYLDMGTTLFADSGFVTANNEYVAYIANSNGSNLNEGFYQSDDYDPISNDLALNFEEDDYFYLVVLDGPGNESWMGEFNFYLNENGTESSETLVSNGIYWEYMISEYNPSNDGSLPATSDLESEISNANTNNSWHSVHTGDNTDVASNEIADSASSISSNSANGGNYTVFRTKYPLQTLFSDAFVAPTEEDSDGNGIPDSIEASKNPYTNEPYDTDNDGIPDFEDYDDNGNGINDIDEIVNDASDNLIDYDLDDDGYYDISASDFDGDGIPDYLDLDNDNDQIADMLEGREDIDGDGFPNYLDADSNDNGIDDYLEYAFEGGKPEDAIKPFKFLELITADSDGDGTPNYLESDADNDGIPNNLDDDFAGDAIEGFGIDTYAFQESDNLLELIAADSDGDGTPNYLEPDADADHNGIPDIDEMNVLSGDNINNLSGDNIIEYDLDGDGTPDIHANDFDKDGIPDYLDIDDDGDNIKDEDEGRGISEEEFFNIMNDPDSTDYIQYGYIKVSIGDTDYYFADTDGDTSPNYQDTDSDEDGIFDDDEYASYVLSSNMEDNIDPLLASVYSSIYSSNPNFFAQYSNPNFFAQSPNGYYDNMPNYLDNDSDGDGIPDNVEGPGDADGDGIPNYLDEDSDGDGIPDIVEAGDDPTNPVDTNGDNEPDFLDTNSDHDGKTDAEESGFVLANGSYELADTNNNGTPDYIESEVFID